MECLNTIFILHTYVDAWPRMVTKRWTLTLFSHFSIPIVNRSINNLTASRFFFKFLLERILHTLSVKLCQIIIISKILTIREREHLTRRNVCTRQCQWIVCQSVIVFMNESILNSCMTHWRLTWARQSQFNVRETLARTPILYPSPHLFPSDWEAFYSYFGFGILFSDFSNLQLNMQSGKHYVRRFFCRNDVSVHQNSIRCVFVCERGIANLPTYINRFIYIRVKMS